MSLIDDVAEYFIALITGIFLLYVLWEVVTTLVQSNPELRGYLIPVAIAGGLALLALAKLGIRR